MPRRFWEDYIQMSEQSKKIALFYVILKTYKICFDFHINVTRNKWQSISRSVTKDDLLMEFNEIGSRDEFVDSWSAETRDRASSQYLTILRQSGLIDEGTGELRCPNVSDEALLWYLQAGEVWFLQACFLPGYKIEQIKQLAL